MADRDAQLLIAGAAGWNMLINRVLPESQYVPANLAATAAVSGWAVMAGKSPEEMGIDVSRVGSGIRWGAAGAAAVVAATTVGSRLRWTRPLFTDQRVDSDDVWYQTLIRIPLGTVLLEELLFRGVLPACLEPNDPGDALSSALFGLWHILPTLKTLDINSINRRTTRVGSVVAAVATTALVGLAFSRLRRRTGSVVAPMMIHWAANASAYALAARSRP